MHKISGISIYFVVSSPHFLMYWTNMFYVFSCYYWAVLYWLLTADTDGDAGILYILERLSIRKKWSLYLKSLSFYNFIFILYSFYARLMYALCCDCEMNIKIVYTKNGDKKERKIPKHQLSGVGSVGLLFTFHFA